MSRGRAAAIVALSLAGFAISVYLWSAKAGAAQLICGPAGDCATVNESAYSEILGVPIAAFGAGMYAVIALCAGLGARRPELGWPAPVGFATAFAGALFSLYLTGLEAFIIRAYCVWCLVSWGLVTAIAAVWGVSFWREKGEGRERSDGPVQK